MNDLQSIANEFILLDHDYVANNDVNRIVFPRLDNDVDVINARERVRQQAALRQRLRRANQNANDRLRHREIDSQRQRNRRANENDFDAQMRRDENAQRQRDLRANENYFDAQIRRNENAQRQRNLRVNENLEQGYVRRQIDAQHHQLIRQNEIPQQAAARRRVELLRHRARAPRYLNLARINNDNALPDCHFLGEFNILCEHCGALKFENESNFKCCSQGKVNLSDLLHYPEELRNLLCSDTAQAKQFRKLIRVYNNAFGFASLGANIRPPPGNGPPCFRICGQLFHRYGALLPDENHNPNYSQLYIVEAANALNLRMANPANQDCNREVMEIIQEVLNRDSPYAAAYRNMAEVEREEQERAVHENRQPSNVIMVMREGEDRRRYNAPLHEEVAAIFVGNDGAPPHARDIIVYPRNQPLRSISYII